MDTLERYYSQIDWEKLLGNKNIDEKVMIFFLAIHTVCKDFVPLKNNKRTKNTKLKIPIDRRILFKKQKKYKRIYK